MLQKLFVSFFAACSVIVDFILSGAAFQILTESPKNEFIARVEHSSVLFLTTRVLSENRKD